MPSLSSATNLPTINGTTCVTGTAKSVTINSGTLTISSGGTLKINGSLTNSATFSNSGTLEFDDDGVNATNQTASGISSIGTLTFNKTAGGAVNLPGAFTVTTK